MCVFGLSYIIIYLNLLSMGFTLKEYFRYVFGKMECLIFLFGYIIMTLCFFMRRKK